MISCDHYDAAFRSGESDKEERRGVFKYERLPILCYKCGRIGHARRDCSHSETLDKNMDMIGYGPWIKGINLQLCRFFGP